jgi:rhamnogalacturonan hydrolase
MHILPLIIAAAALPTFILAQLSGKVGPLTSHASKTAKKTCNILNYGAKADKATDVGPPLLKAFTDCKTGGTVVVPVGDYAMKSWVTFEGGKAWALQLDGTIYRTGTESGNMLFIRNANDFEMFSSTGTGAVQGR